MHFHQICTIHWLIYFSLPIRMKLSNLLLLLGLVAIFHQGMISWISAIPKLLIKARLFSWLRPLPIPSLNSIWPLLIQKNQFLPSLRGKSLDSPSHNLHFMIVSLLFRTVNSMPHLLNLLKDLKCVLHTLSRKYLEKISEKIWSLKEQKWIRPFWKSILSQQATKLEPRRSKP